MTPFTREEFNKIPITGHGKILRYLADVQAYEDQADLAIKGYRDYLGTLFDTKAQEARDKEEKKAAAPPSWYQFWK
jgi:hypothetical protein